MLALRQRLCWQPPQRCDVLQFTGTTITGLQPLASEFSLQNMPSIAEQVNVWVLIRTIRQGCFNRWAYYRKFVEMTTARVVLVWHDTSLEAYRLQARLPVPVWLIQNGVRHDVAPARGEGLVTLLRRLKATEQPTASRYFCFGNPTRELLAPLVDTEFVNIGSFRLNEFALQRPKPEISRRGHPLKIGFIVSFPNQSDVPGGKIANNDSPFVRLGGSSISYSEYFKPDAVVLRLLNDVVRSQGYELFVIGKRSSRDPIERDYFATIPGCEDIEVLSHEKGSGYAVAANFDFLITIDSTLGYEMLALKQKVGFVSNRFRMLGISTKEMSFAYPADFPNEGPFWTSAIAEPGIKNFLNTFFRVDDSSWISLWRDIVPTLMHLDPGNQVLRELLASETKPTI